MQIVCSWCNRYLGKKDPPPHDVVSHTICPACLARQEWEESPTLVISRAKAHILRVLEQLLQGSPEIRLVVDRRLGERRGALAEVSQEEDRRQGSERRQGSLLLVL